MFIIEIYENYHFNIDVLGGTVGHGSSVAQLPYVMPLQSLANVLDDTLFLISLMLYKLEGPRASTGLSLLCVDLGYKQWSNDRPLCA